MDNSSNEARAKYHTEGSSQGLSLERPLISSNALVPLSLILAVNIVERPLVPVSQRP